MREGGRLVLEVDGPAAVTGNGGWSETTIGMTARWCPQSSGGGFYAAGRVGHPATGFAAPAVNTAHPGKSATGPERVSQDIDGGLGGAIPSPGKPVAILVGNRWRWQPPIVGETRLSGRIDG
jgi:hypothetical protein